MAIFSGQAPGSATATRLVVIPPGPGWVTLANGGTVPAYLGFGTTATTTGGCPFPSGGVLSFELFQGSSGGGTLWAITSSGTATIGWIVSTASGLGQPGQQ